MYWRFYLTGNFRIFFRKLQTFGEEVELKTGEVVRLTTDETYKDRCSTYTVYVDFMYFAEQLKKNDYILLDNESIMLKVEMISTTTLTCKIERGGFLGSYKDVFVPNVVLDMPNYTDKDKLDIEFAIQQQVLMFSLAYVSCLELMILKSVHTVFCTGRYSNCFFCKLCQLRPRIEIHIGRKG